MELTAVQQRTLDALLDVGDGRPFEADLPFRLRDRIESELSAIDIPGPIRLGKERLNDHNRCEGLFQAVLAGEAPPFEHSLKSAAGSLLHKCIELEVAAREPPAALDLAQVGAERLASERQFGPFWTGLSALEQDEVILEAVRRVELFRASFPSLRWLRRRMAPIAELHVESVFAGGAVTVSGRIDLALGAVVPGRGTRVLLDLKTGRAWPEHPEDMRLYALLHTLRFGVPPFRVATLFLGSGEWQPEDVTEEVLEHAAGRVVAAARTAARLLGDQAPDALTPGPWCGWCPRRATCPVARVEG